jgi:hypothetical protein
MTTVTLITDSASFSDLYRSLYREPCVDAAKHAKRPHLLRRDDRGGHGFVQGLLRNFKLDAQCLYHQEVSGIGTADLELDRLPDLQHNRVWPKMWSDKCQREFEEPGGLGRRL